MKPSIVSRLIYPQNFVFLALTTPLSDIYIYILFYLICDIWHIYMWYMRCDVRLNVPERCKSSHAFHTYSVHCAESNISKVSSMACSVRACAISIARVTNRAIIYFMSSTTGSRSQNPGNLSEALQPPQRLHSDWWTQKSFSTARLALHGNPGHAVTKNGSVGHSFFDFGSYTGRFKAVERL